MPLRELFEFTHGDTQGEELSYAQSWALADLLMTSPAYAARWPVFVAAMASGLASGRALSEVYHMPLDAIERNPDNPRPLP